MTATESKFLIPKPLLPPEHMRTHKRDADYYEEAIYTIRTIDEFVSIQPHFKVLDVGCAAGRVALPLTGYLDAQAGGLYEGFDIQAERIQWATKHISSLYPNFRFRFVDVRHQYMNDAGTVDGSLLVFPYPDHHFDLIIFSSVFTHLLPEVAFHYLSEAARVLVSTGRIYSTWYLWDSPTAEAVRSHTVLWSFPIDRGNHRVMEVERPDLAVAFVYESLRQAIHDSGLRVDSEARGSWRVSPNHGQDILILAKD